MNIKRLILILVLLVILIFGGYEGYRYLYNDYSQIGLELHSQDNRYSVNVPLDWEEVKPASSSVLLAAQGKNGDMYMQISLDGEVHENSLLTYVKNYIREIGQNSDNSANQVTVVSPANKKIDGHSGYYFELETITREMEVHIWSFCYATSAGYIRVNITAPASETSTYSDVALSILDSFNGK